MNNLWSKEWVVQYVSFALLFPSATLRLGIYANLNNSKKMGLVRINYLFG